MGRHLRGFREQRRHVTQVIIGVSAAFLVWDAIDLGFTINDLVRKQGSKAARVLREKAATLEGALDETLASYSVQLPD